MVRLKNENDLKKKIPDFVKFCRFLKKHEYIIDTGRLSEWYCKILFNLKLSSKSNELYDAEDRQGNRVEIKQRNYSGKTPGGMKMDLKRISYVFYVKLNESLLPEIIHKIDKKDIIKLSNGRVSFRKAFNENIKAKIVYKQK